MAIKIIGVIPARMESTRLPGKPLRMIAGKPMIAWVYDRASRAQGLDRLLVATDSEEIRKFCDGKNIPVRMTSRAHRSGTERIIEVMDHEPADVYVNIQGDEPLVTGRHIEQMLAALDAPSEVQIATLKVEIGEKEAEDPNVTKVVTNELNWALYFSRAKIPADRDRTGAVRYYKHLGFYTYTKAALREFARLAPSELETAERLEQLRFLHHGIAIAVAETDQDTIGVDTEADLGRAEEFLLREKMLSQNGPAPALQQPASRQKKGAARRSRPSKS